MGSVEACFHHTHCLLWAVLKPATITHHTLWCLWAVLKPVSITHHTLWCLWAVLKPVSITHHTLWCLWAVLKPVSITHHTLWCLWAVLKPVSITHHTLWCLWAVLKPVSITHHTLWCLWAVLEPAPITLYRSERRCGVFRYVSSRPDQHLADDSTNCAIIVELTFLSTAGPAGGFMTLGATVRKRESQTPFSPAVPRQSLCVVVCAVCLCAD